MTQNTRKLEHLRAARITAKIRYIPSLHPAVLQSSNRYKNEYALQAVV